VFFYCYRCRVAYESLGCFPAIDPGVDIFSLSVVCPEYVKAARTSQLMLLVSGVLQQWATFQAVCNPVTMLGFLWPPFVPTTLELAILVISNFAPAAPMPRWSLIATHLILTCVQQVNALVMMMPILVSTKLLVALMTGSSCACPSGQGYDWELHSLLGN
jgi:hypothetical protein